MNNYIYIFYSFLFKGTEEEYDLFLKVKLEKEQDRVKLEKEKIREKKE